MSQPARPLKILVVSPEISVLHDVSWMLTAVGYQVFTSKDSGENAAWRQFGETDFIVYDGRSISNPTSATLAHRSDNPLYRIFLYDPATATDFAAWFAAGANDALRVPVSRGELLVRIRAGARMLEFENRMRSQSCQSPLTGMYSQRGLLRKLSKLTTAGKSVTLVHTLLTTGIDFFPGFCRADGESAARDLLAALAAAIPQTVGGNALAAYAGDGTFHIVLPGRKAAAARVVADQIAQAFAAAQAAREFGVQLTLTTAIIPWQVGVSPEELLQQGQETLAVAVLSGGDSAVEQNVFAKELADWQNEFTAGSPFANVIAQDLMEPFPAVLERDSANQAMLAALRRCQAPVWPFVDQEGRLIGVASPRATDEIAEWEPNSSGKPVLATPVTIAHNAAFPEIYEAFSTQGCLEMVVVAEHRPIGYLTCRGFTSLIEPINTATFSRAESAREDSRNLLVDSLINEFEQTSDSDQ